MKKEESTVLWKREQGWDKLGDKEIEALNAYIDEYIDFISTAKTERLAHDTALAMAKAAGFKNLDELPESRKLKAGDKVYRSCNGKTLFLAVIGKQPLEKGLSLVGAHIDCPRLDAKPSPLYEDGSIAYLDTHYYGGIKKYQWLTLPLALYGTIYRRDGSRVDISIGDAPEDPVFNISDLLRILTRTALARPSKRRSTARP